MPWLMVLVLIGAVTRVTVLIRTDRITRAMRYAIARRLQPDGYLSYLLSCPWCISIWVGFFAAATAYFWWHDAAYRIVALALALSYATGMLSSGPWEDDSDMPLDEPAHPQPFTGA